MSACVQKNNRALGDVGDIGHSTSKVKPTCVGVIVGVSTNIEAGVLEDRSVVAPAGLWQVNCPEQEEVFIADVQIVF